MSRSGATCDSQTTTGNRWVRGSCPMATGKSLTARRQVKTIPRSLSRPMGAAFEARTSTCSCKPGPGSRSTRCCVPAFHCPTSNCLSSAASCRWAPTPAWACPASAWALGMPAPSIWRSRGARRCWAQIRWFGACQISLSIARMPISWSTARSLSIRWRDWSTTPTDHPGTGPGTKTWVKRPAYGLQTTARPGRASAPGGRGRIWGARRPASRCRVPRLAVWPSTSPISCHRLAPQPPRSSSVDGTVSCPPSTTVTSRHQRCPGTEGCRSWHRWPDRHSPGWKCLAGHCRAVAAMAASDS